MLVFETLFPHALVMRSRQLLLRYLLFAICLSSLYGQSPPPPPSFARPEAVYTPQPVYRPEWAKKGLAGKGIVLVTIDPRTGAVTGARMLQSTGNQLLDGAALQAYSQWRFKPGSVTQLKMPIEFRNRPPPQKASQRRPTSPFVYGLVILIAFAAVVMLTRTKRS